MEAKHFSQNVDGPLAGRQQLQRGDERERDGLGRLIVRLRPRCSIGDTIDERVRTRFDPQHLAEASRLRKFSRLRQPFLPGTGATSAPTDPFAETRSLRVLSGPPRPIRFDDRLCRRLAQSRWWRVATDLFETRPGCYPSRSDLSWDRSCIQHLEAQIRGHINNGRRSNPVRPWYFAIPAL